MGFLDFLSFITGHFPRLYYAAHAAQCAFATNSSHCHYAKNKKNNKNMYVYINDF